MGSVPWVPVQSEDRSRRRTSQFEESRRVDARRRRRRTELLLKGPFALPRPRVKGGFTERMR